MMDSVFAGQFLSKRLFKIFDKTSLVSFNGFHSLFLCCRNLAKEIGCYCVLATHFHELTSLAEEIPTVVNYHVTAVADDNGLTMLYKIEKGPCDRSFGIHVASHVDFPPDVIAVQTYLLEISRNYFNTFLFISVC